MMSRSILFTAIGVLLLNGCQTAGGPAPSVGKNQPRPAISKELANETNVAENFVALGKSRRAEATKWQASSFEEFERQVTRETGTGNYIVNGDVVISDRKRLQEFFDNEVKQPRDTAELIVHAPGGVKAVWSDTQKRNLTYCVSDSFGADKPDIVAAMTAAGEAWAEQGDIQFVYSAIHDGNCTAINPQVVFDVRPVTGQTYLARAFFPDDFRGNRNVLINDSALNLGPGNLSLEGILRHELGHTLGFRHEHTRPDAGACFEDDDWVPLTAYDAFSVMHYPQCNGHGDWSLELTDMDKLGTCKQYGAGPGFTGDASQCAVTVTPPASGCGPVQVIETGTVGNGEMDRFGPYAVVAGTEFNVTMSGSGDPDLYVSFVTPPTQSVFNCRPFLTGATESCLLTVPQNATAAHVMVHGFAAGSYQLQIEHTFNNP